MHEIHMTVSHCFPLTGALGPCCSHEIPFGSVFGVYENQCRQHQQMGKPHRPHKMSSASYLAMVLFRSFYFEVAFLSGLFFRSANLGL